MMIGYIPDPFGHPGQVPQILRGFWHRKRPACGADWMKNRSEFWWQSPDGSRVLMAYLRDSYSNGASLPADNLPAFCRCSYSRSRFPGSPFGRLRLSHHVRHRPHGAAAQHLQKPSLMPISNYRIRTLSIRNLPKFVAAVQADIQEQKLALPTVTGELRACKRMHLLPGVLSTRMWIKQRNHASENLLTKWVEPFTVWQELATGAQSSILNQKSAILHQAWRLLMENHPHDSICGCSIDQVHNEMKVRFDQVDQIGAELARQALRRWRPMFRHSLKWGKRPSWFSIQLPDHAAMLSAPPWNCLLARMSSIWWMRTAPACLTRGAVSAAGRSSI